MDSNNVPVVPARKYSYFERIQKMKDEDDDEETQALIRKQEKTLLKVLKYKLKDRWPFVKKPDFWDLQQNNENPGLNSRDFDECLKSEWNTLQDAF